ncbi:hypothetical protein OBBRIDRAFT_825050 [Obba rivulosa]|uniref:F-box domain-containing protein n=1 Tax=Obba rivulosa TaxID=1052685 RepID=A0A8E2B514_9APHY|nr:hypothetical protein OBBRIDRAFT_825050 [Obba rivulosa]
MQDIEVQGSNMFRPAGIHTRHPSDWDTPSLQDITSIHTSLRHRHYCTVSPGCVRAQVGVYTRNRTRRQLVYFPRPVKNVGALSALRHVYCARAFTADVRIHLRRMCNQLIGGEGRMQSTTAFSQQRYHPISSGARGMEHSTPQLNYDVIQNIFDQLSPQHKGVCDRPTLARAARASRMLSELALDSLWSRLDNLRPLFMVLHIGEVYDIAELARTRGQYGSGESPTLTTHTISDRTWSRFRQYAHRVRSLAYDEYTDQIPPIPFSALASRARYDPILPLLQELKWSRTIPGNLEFTRFITSDLRVLHVNLSRGPGFPSGSGFGTLELQEELLQVLHSRCTNVEVLTFRDYMPASWETLLQFPRLRTVSLRSATPHLFYTAAIDTLASSEILENLTIDLPWNGHADVWIATDTPSFRALKQLNMASRDDAWCTFREFLLQISSTELSVLRIRYGCNSRLRPEDGCNDLACLRVLSERWSSSLTKIALIVSECYTIEFGFVSSGRLLEPLLPLHRLEDVTLKLSNHSPCTILLQDGDIQMMAKSWPNLRSLRIELTERHADANYGGPSIYSLVHLAVRCRFLVKLQLSYLLFDGQRTPTRQLGHLARNLPHYNLRHMHVHHLFCQRKSSLPELTAAVGFLVRTFPRLSFCGDGDCAVLNCNWSTITQAVKEYKEIWCFE